MDHALATAAPPSAAATRKDRRWLILAVIATAQLMIVLDSTIVNVAMPSAQADLGFADSTRQWVVTAYALAFGSLLLLSGRLGDIFGRKRSFIAGLAGFAIASAVGGAATNVEVLLGARAAQGLFGALLAPSALSLLTTTFTEPKQRGKAFAVFGMIAGAGGALGLLLSGILTSYASWRWCFYINLPIAAVAMVGGLLLLSNPTRVGLRPRIDVPGTILASAGVFAIVFGFSRAETESWSSFSTVGSLALGAALIIAFVLIQRIVAHPLLPLRIVLDRKRGGAYLAVGLTFTAGFAIFLFLTYFLQQVRGFTPVMTGAAFMPMPAGIIAASTIANLKLLPRFGSRRLIVIGLVFGFAGMAVLAFLHSDSGYAPHVLPALLLVGIGIGLVVPPAMNSATAGVDPHDAGVASAMVNTTQQLGGSIGTALLSTFAAQATGRHLTSHGPITESLTNDAATHGFAIAFAIAAGIFLGAAALCGAVIPRHTRAITAPPVAPDPLA
jgi:EmrB/QacA subfamily drug resistance transporter